MAMTLDRQMHRQLLDMLGAKDQEDAARIIAAFHGANLSAQAKVRVTDEDVEQAIEAYELAPGVMQDRAMRAALESFAARLSQGAQGKDEPQAWLHILHAELSQNIAQLSVSEENPFGKRGVDYDPSYTVTSVPLYTHPAERAAVPDGWALKWTGKYITIMGPSGLIRVDLTDPTSLVFRFLEAMLDAAPQPPEGARVVDGFVTLPIELLRSLAESSSDANVRGFLEPILIHAETTAKGGA